MKADDIKPGASYFAWTITGEPYRDVRRRVLIPVTCACGEKGTLRVCDVTSGMRRCCKHCSTKKGSRWFRPCIEDNLARHVAAFPEDR